MSFTKYIGLKYLAKGRDTNGIDCWGLVKLFYKQELDVDVPSYTEDYTEPADRKSVSSVIIENIGNWRQVVNPQVGDLLLFQILGLPLHTGVYVGNNDFLHAFMGCDSCIERLSSITWNRRLLGIYRWVKT